MKKVLSFIFILIISISCKNKNSNIKYVTVDFQTISDSLITSFPGSILLSNDYIIWEDPLAEGSLAHIINKKSGKFVDDIGTFGKGPDEFASPNLQFCQDNKIFISDFNSNQQAFFSIDSIIVGKNPIIKIPNFQIERTTNIINTDNDYYITFKPTESKPFNIVPSNIHKSFGLLPIKKVNNKMAVFQGKIAYHCKEELLFYSTYEFPYFAIYQKENNNYSLKKEIKPKFDYNIINGRLVVDSRKQGIRDLTISKNYLITIQRDYVQDQTNEQTVGRDFSKNPKTIFIYDLNGKLLKIIDCKMPVIRIAAETENNTVYAIVLDKEFRLIKFSL